MAEEPTWPWADMLAEFRALGGTADNVRLGSGPRGRGLFPIDPQRDVRLHTPAHLLVNVDDVVLADGHLAVRPASAMAPRAKAFFERFERTYSYSAGSAEDCRRKIAAFHALPDAVQDYLNEDAPAEQRRYPAPTPETVLRLFLRTRWIERSPPGAPAAGGKYWLMPVIELVNHSGDHAPIDRSNGAAVVGRFPNEVVAAYGGSDTWSVFVSHYYVAPASTAFSLPMVVRSPSGLRYEIGHDTRATRVLDGVPVPAVEQKGPAIVISHVLLGNRMAPGLARMVLRRAMREHRGDDVDALFDVIANRNRVWFQQLLHLLEPYRGQAVEDMRRAARLQLKTIAFASGAGLGQAPGQAALSRSAGAGRTPERPTVRRDRRR